MALARRSVLRKDKTGQALLRQKIGALAKEMGFKWPLGTSSACLLCAIMHADSRLQPCPPARSLICCDTRHFFLKNSHEKSVTTTPKLPF
jgi:hypothetical protein